MVARFLFMSVLFTVARLSEVGVLNVMARFGLLGVFHSVARFKSLGVLLALTRFNLVGALPFVARLKHLCGLQPLAIRAQNFQPRSAGRTILVCPSFSSTYNGRASSPASVLPTNQ